MMYVGNVNLTNHTDFQAVYFSQLYGTFFGVFCKFDCDENENDANYCLEQVDFRLINYKGPLNLGITKVESKHLHEEDGVFHVVFKIEVQALGGKLEYPYQCHIDVPKLKSMFHFDRRVLKMKEYSMDQVSSVFDNEFYYREGLIDEGGEYPPRKPPVRQWNDPEESKKLNHTLKLVGGTKCPRSVCHVI